MVLGAVVDTNGMKMKGEKYGDFESKRRVRFMIGLRATDRSGEKNQGREVISNFGNMEVPGDLWWEGTKTWWCRLKRVESKHVEMVDYYSRFIPEETGAWNG